MISYMMFTICINWNGSKKIISANSIWRTNQWVPLARCNKDKIQIKLINSVVYAFLTEKYQSKFQR